MSKKNKEHIKFSFTNIILSEFEKFVHYTVTFTNEDEDGSYEELYILEINLTDEYRFGTWNVDSKSLTTKRYKAIGQFVDNVLLDYKECKNDISKLLKNFQFTETK